MVAVVKVAGVRMVAVVGAWVRAIRTAVTDRVRRTLNGVQEIGAEEMDVMERGRVLYSSVPSFSGTKTPLEYQSFSHLPVGLS